MKKEMSVAKASRLTTLILGAGLGKEYGFPDGPGLRQMIIGELTDHERELKEILEWSPAETVDEIAASHPEHADRMRKIVTRILRRCENPTPLQQSERPNTYKLMLKQIYNAQAKGDQVRIITFNYDRSLQYLLHRVNGITPQEKRIDPTIITTIYGRLAPLGFEDSVNRNRPMKHHTYGEEVRQEISSVRSSFDLFDEESDIRDSYHSQSRYYEQQLELQAEKELFQQSTIRFIGELNELPTPIVTTTLKESHQIFLLGLGYHKANLQLLGLDFTKPNNDKLIAGTGYGLSPDYIGSLKEMYPAISRIESCNAFTFLKSKFDISEPDANLLKRSPSILNVL